jgi:hypothetical protein
MCWLNKKQSYNMDAGFSFKLYSHQTKSGEDEVLIYGSKNSALKDTMDFINQQKSYNTGTS